jgi:hypothetical protein
VTGGAQQRRYRADDVIGLVRRAPELGDAEQAAELAAEAELALELGRCRLAVLLVGREDLVPKRGRQRLVEGDRDVLRPCLLEQVPEEAAEAVQRVDRLAVAVSHLEAHGVVGAKDEVARVDQVDAGGPACVTG